MAEQALSAIQRAAANMATVVNNLEDKIRTVVSEVQEPVKVQKYR